MSFNFSAKTKSFNLYIFLHIKSRHIYNRIIIVVSLLNKEYSWQNPTILPSEIEYNHITKVFMYILLSSIAHSNILPKSCRDILLRNPNSTSGVYWIKPMPSPYHDAFGVYCDMKTHQGGWTLVYSYTFINFNNFYSKTNAVTPPSKLACPRGECPRIHHTSAG